MFYSVWATLSVQKVSVNTLTAERLFAVRVTLLLTAGVQETDFCHILEMNAYNLLFLDRYK
jgi:hypothetical protein